MAGALSVDDALNMQFVLSRLIRPMQATVSANSSALSTFTSTLSSMANSNLSSKDVLAVTPLTGNSASTTAKTFVAQPPEVIPVAALIATLGGESRRNSSELKHSGATYTSDIVPVVASWGQFPDLQPCSFGNPRAVVFPRQSDDTDTLSLGTLVPKAATRSNQSRGQSKDVGLEWMQQLLQSVSKSAKRTDTNDLKPTSDCKQTTSFPAPFARSRTIDRQGVSREAPATSRSINRTAAYHRSFTQHGLYAGDLAGGATSAIMLNKFHTMRSPDLRGDRRKVGHRRVRSTDALPGTTPFVWLASVLTCDCCDTVTNLTEELVDAHFAIEPNQNATTDSIARGLERVADVSCALINALGECGHPAEAKAVFEDCLMKVCHHGTKENTLRCLETIADKNERGAWKVFSSLVRCYVKNGLVLRAFDLLVQVKIRDERMLDPSLGVLNFSASVKSAERQVVLQRIYASFSAGNLGLALGSRDPGTDRGCIVLSTGNRAKNERYVGPNEAPSSIVEPNDLIETVNGEMVLHYPFPVIVARLKRACRPMAVTFLRGMAKAKSLHAWYNEQSASVQPISDLASALSVLNWSSSTAATAQAPPIVDDSAPRSTLCDRFGFLPERGICIKAVADCADCGARASLADIQAGWSLKDENDYTTRCSRCGRRYVPRLNIRMGGETDENGCDDQDLQVEYLSTPVVRKELANLAQKLTLSAVTMSELRSCNPRIYWNIVVKLLSLECPLDFMDLPYAHTPSAHDKHNCESNDECDSVTSDVSISCGTEPRPLTDDEDNACESYPNEKQSGNKSSSLVLGSNNNDSADNGKPDMDVLERVFVAVMDAEEFDKGKEASFDVVATRIMARLRHRVIEQE